MEPIMLDRENNTMTIRLAGSATTATADRRHTVLMEALQSEGPVAVDCSDLTDWDVTLWQHLVAFKQALTARKRRLVLCPNPLPERMLHSLRVCGLLEELGSLGDAPAREAEKQ